jgi:hypothetical protein
MRDNCAIFSPIEKEIVPIGQNAPQRLRESPFLQLAEAALLGPAEAGTPNTNLFQIPNPNQYPIQKRAS